MVRLPLELLPCLLLGMVLALRLPGLPGRLAPPLMRWGIPLSLAALLLRSQLSLVLLRVGLLGLVVPLLSLLLVALPPLRRRLDANVLLLGAALGNTGYWGLPVALALLPPQALAAVITYDLAGSVITWGVGPLVLRGRWGGGDNVLKTLLANPALQGFALCALLAPTPWRATLALWLWWPARLVFLIALTLVGMRLGVCLRERRLEFSGGVPWALACKLLLVPLLVWLLAIGLRLPPLDRQALVLQGAAPTALSVLLMAEAERKGASLASTMVLLSTLAAMGTVPLWWSVMR